MTSLADIDSKLYMGINIYKRKSRNRTKKQIILEDIVKVLTAFIGNDQTLNTMYGDRAAPYLSKVMPESASILAIS